VRCIIESVVTLQDWGLCICVISPYDMMLTHSTVQLCLFVSWNFILHCIFFVISLHLVPAVELIIIVYFVDSGWALFLRNTALSLLGFLE
jgi:hypothetical protein